jgi:DNA-directed RNA polymerase alpha subunit
MDFSQKVRQALTQAADDKEPIDDLEFLGVPTRTLSILSTHGITTMDQLLSKTREELCALRSLSTTSVNRILQGLQHYDELAEIVMNAPIV